MTQENPLLNIKTEFEYVNVNSCITDEVKDDFKNHVKIEAGTNSVTVDIKLESKSLINIKQEKIYVKDEMPPPTNSIPDNGTPDDHNSSTSTQNPNVLGFTCNSCNFKTTKKGNFDRHIKIHTGEKPFPCNFCEFRAVQKSVLMKHIRTHTGEKPFSCNLCEFKAIQKNTLIKHIRTHTGEKPFVCSLCNYKCNQKWHLTNHIRGVHAREKGIQCSLCDFKTVWKNQLTSHMRMHTGEQPFACKLCDFKTTWKYSLTNHMKVHTKKSNSAAVSEFK